MRKNRIVTVNIFCNYWISKQRKYSC